jgi:predicted ATPase
MHGVKGYAAPELADVFRRIRQLCDTLGETPQLFGAVAAIGAFHFMRAELGPATAAIAEMRRLAEITGDPVMSIWTDWAHGATFSHFGISLADTIAELDRGARLYDERMHAGFMLMTGFDAGMGCEFQAARVAWMLGDAEAATTRIEATVAQARRLRHPLMLGFSLFFQAWIRQHARDPEGVLAVTAELLPLVDQYGYPHVGAWARIVDGWARAMTGQAADGEVAIRGGLAVLDAIGITLMRPNYLALLAEAQAMQGHIDEALATLDAARDTAIRTEERCYLAEIHRLSGVWLSQSPGAASQATEIERRLREAVSVAREQGAGGFARLAEATLADFLAPDKYA